MLKISNSLINKKRHSASIQYVTEFTKSSASRISVTNHADFHIDGEDFTISFWINFTEDASGTSNKDGPIGLSMGNFRGGGCWFEYNDNSGDDQTISFYTDTGSAKSATTSSGYNLTHDTWYHVAATYDLSATTAKLYIDGEVRATNASSGAPGNFTGTIYVGSLSPYASFKASQVAFWNGALFDADTIRSLISDSNLRYFRPQPTAYWRLGGESNAGTDKTIDLSGSGHHGTSGGLVTADFRTTGTPTGV